MSNLWASTLRGVVGCFAAVSLAACFGDVSGSSSVATGSTYYTVGGNVLGLSGSGLVLQDNTGDSLAVSAAGAFTFPTPLARGNSYSVSVSTQPLTPSQTCVVTNGSGSITTADVTDVTVTCANKTSTTDAIGGSVSGLAGSGLVLQNDGGDNLAVVANGSFVFAAGLPSGMPYAVTVLTPPMNPFQNCAVVNGTGTTAGSDINNVTVSCTTNSNPAYTIGGTISGVSNSGPIVLQDDGTDNLTVSSDGTFTFATPIPTGSAYSVTALSSSASQSRTCAFTNASGVVGSANVTSVAIVCTATAPAVNISVSVTGFNATTLVLQNNGGDNLTIAANGTATFATPLASGTSFAVTVLTQPTGQTCTVTNGTGTATSSTAAAVVACQVDTYSVGGAISGLNPGNQVTLVDNGGNAVTSVNGGFVFTAPVVYDGNYAVTVATQPVGQICTVMGGSGTGVVANVTTVSVACSTDTYTIGGTVAGLTAGSEVTLQNNGGNALTLANGRFTFTTPVAYNGGYAVTVSGQPIGQTCSVAGGTGAGVVANVTTVTVTCSVRTFTISGIVVNLGVSTQVTLDDNGADPRTVTASGAFTFATPVAYNGSYSVTVGTQPTGQTCTVSNGVGAGVIANISTVTVTCSPLTFTIGGTLQLGAGTQVTLDNNGADPLTLAVGGAFTFSTPVVYNGNFAVTVGTQPIGQTCSVANGTGAGVTANVTNVAVTCSPLTYTIRGTLENLGTGTQVTLDNNGANPLILTANGGFGFTTPVPYNGSYAVTVGTQPTGQICTVTNGSGAGVVANVVNVLVNCAVRTFTVSGNVDNLGGGTQVTLDDNNGDPTTVSTVVTGNVGFMFATPIAYGSGYSVTVGTEPTGQTCTVSNGAGVDVTANVTNVAVNCATTTFTVSGTVTGLAPGGQVTLDNNQANPETVTGNANGSGTFTFSTPVAYNGSYAVTVGTEPTGQECTVANGAGSNVQANVANVSVTCANTYTIGGSVTALLEGTQLVLDDNGGDALIVPGAARPNTNDSSTFTFATPLVSGSTYAVTIATQPTGQACTIANGTGSGTATANVTSVSVSCVPNSFYTVSGTVSGLTDANEVVGLALNNGDVQDVTGTGLSGCCSFAFDTTIPYDGSYTVSVSSQPANEFCTVTSNASGSNVTANVTNVGVTCAVDTYTVSGTVSGLANGLQVVLDNNGGDPQTVTGGGNGQFQFTPIAAGSAYAVTVASQPTGQVCTVSNGTGNVSANVNNVSVSCVNAYTIGGTISGLGAFGLNIQLTDSYDSGDPFLEPATNSTSYVFPNYLPAGTMYTATITEVPSGYGCQFGSEQNGTTSVTGMVGTADVSLINLGCYPVP